MNDPTYSRTIALLLGTLVLVLFLAFSLSFSPRQSFAVVVLLGGVGDIDHPATVSAGAVVVSALAFSSPTTPRTDNN